MEAVMFRRSARHFVWCSHQVMHGLCTKKLEWTDPNPTVDENVPVGFGWVKTDDGWLCPGHATNIEEK